MNSPTMAPVKASPMFTRSTEMIQGKRHRAGLGGGAGALDLGGHHVYAAVSWLESMLRKGVRQ
jgi:hypothetical protein